MTGKEAVLLIEGITTNDPYYYHNGKAIYTDSKKDILLEISHTNCLLIIGFLLDFDL